MSASSSAGKHRLGIQAHPSPAAPSPPPPAEEPSRRRPWIYPLIALVIIGVFLGIGLLLFPGSKGRENPAAASGALAALAELQRDWWDGENLSAAGAPDPDAALLRLMERQREWWDLHGLSKDNNFATGAALPRLDRLQREWWEKEGLAAGKPSGDAASALARLEALNGPWWQAEGVVAAPSNPASAAGEFTSVEGVDPDIQLIDKDSTRRFMAAGGSRESEQAVAQGLRWLAAQQQADGGWSLHTARGRGKSDVVATGFALLPFLAHGETHKGTAELHEYHKVVELGLLFLLKRQKDDGDLRDGGAMYVHGIASIALAEAYGLTGDPMLMGPCQKAVNFIVAAQDPKGGGWRYTPKQAGDLSVTAWQLQALKSAQMAGIIIPRDTLEGGIRFLNSVAMKNNDGYQYTRGAVGHWEPIGPSTTAYGILCRQYLQGNEDLRSPVMSRGVERILAVPPPEGKNMYYYYYATNVLHNIGDDRWLQWNPKMRDLLVSTQIQGEESALKGSWDPLGKRFGGYSGRLMTTSLALLTLEVYYRHMQVNRPELGDAAKDLNTKGK